MKKLSSVQGGAGQGETGCMAAGMGVMGPPPWLCWREGAEDAAASVPSYPVRDWGRLLAFSQQENHLKLLNSV